MECEAGSLTSCAFSALWPLSSSSADREHCKALSKPSPAQCLGTQPLASIRTVTAFVQGSFIFPWIMITAFSLASLLSAPSHALSIFWCWQTDPCKSNLILSFSCFWSFRNFPLHEKKRSKLLSLGGRESRAVHDQLLYYLCLQATMPPQGNVFELHAACA